jgi:anaerobic C4-dicarboxylate transporter DcuA
MIFLQLAVLLSCIFIGARMSGIGLGVMGMIGLLIALAEYRHMFLKKTGISVLMVLYSG